MFHGDGIALVEVPAQLEISVDSIGKIPLSHLTEKLGQIVHDKAILVCDVFWTHLGDFPPWYVGMKTVEEGRIDHGLGKRCQ